MKEKEFKYLVSDTSTDDCSILAIVNDEENAKNACIYFKNLGYYPDYEKVYISSFKSIKPIYHEYIMNFEFSSDNKNIVGDVNLYKNGLTEEKYGSCKVSNIDIYGNDPSLKKSRKKEIRNITIKFSDERDFINLKPATLKELARQKTYEISEGKICLEPISFK